MKVLVIVLAAVCILWVTPVAAQQGIQFGRMSMACNDKPVTCHGLVKELERKLRFAGLVYKGGGFSELWSVTMIEARALIAQLKRDFPGVWEVQNCPMGVCHMHWDTPVPVPDPRHIKPFDPSLRSI